MAIRRYLRWLSTYWIVVTYVLVGAGLLTGCVIRSVALNSTVAKFTQLCENEHGKVYYKRHSNAPVCLRGVELEFPEFEEEQND